MPAIDRSLSDCRYAGPVDGVDSLGRPVKMTIKDMDFAATDSDDNVIYGLLLAH